MKEESKDILTKLLESILDIKIGDISFFLYFIKSESQYLLFLYDENNKLNILDQIN